MIVYFVHMTLQCCVFLESLVQAMLKKKVDGYVNEIGDVLLNRVIILVVTSHGPFSRRPKFHFAVRTVSKMKEAI